VCNVYELYVAIAGEPDMGERRVIGHCSHGRRRVEPHEGRIDLGGGVVAHRDGSVMSCDGERVYVVSM
jgi:hypothetical protein